MADSLNMRTFAKRITSHAFGRSLLGLKTAAELGAAAGIQAGNTDVTTVAGVGTITFPTAYGSAPVVVAGEHFSTSGTHIHVKVQAVTTTDFTVHTILADGTVFSGSATVPWIAYGTPA